MHSIREHKGLTQQLGHMKRSLEDMEADTTWRGVSLATSSLRRFNDLSLSLIDTEWVSYAYANWKLQGKSCFFSHIVRRLTRLSHRKSKSHTRVRNTHMKFNYSIPNTWRDVSDSTISLWRGWYEWSILNSSILLSKSSSFSLTFPRLTFLRRFGYIDRFPLPEATPEIFRMLPEYLIEDITEFLTFVSKFVSSPGACSPRRMTTKTSPF